MKNRAGAVLLLLLIAGMACKEQQKDTTTKEITKAKGEAVVPPTKDEVESAVVNFNKAMVDPTEELMDELCSEKLTYGHSSGLIQNKAEFVDDIVNGPFDFLSVEALDQTINLSGNTAIVRHIFLAKASNKGEPVDIRIGNVQVYQRGGNGSLKLLARQAYKLPPAN